MGSLTLTPTLRRAVNLSVSSPLTPIDFLSPTSSLRRTRPVTFANQAGGLAENDDATEKQQRQMISRANALQSPRSLTPKSANRLNSVEGPSASGSAGMTNIQLKDLYANCIKLSTENKINSKNAFGLPLIDYMQELLTNMDKDQGVTNFQMASCTLDASAKIYAGRVDSIHAQAYKMLGGLGQAENANEEGGEVIDCSGDSEKASRKKKVHKAVRTIETNVNSINVDQVDLVFEIDPLFHKTSASFDEGGTSGFLLSNLYRRNDLCETLLDSNTVTTPTMVDFDFGATQTVSVSDMRDIEKRLIFPSVKICSHFADFSFNDWDSDAEVIGGNETSFNKDNEQAFDMDAPATFDVVNDVPDMDAGGFDDCDGEDDGFVDGAGNMNTDVSGNSLTFADGQEAQIFLSGQMRAVSTSSGCVQDFGNLVLSLSSDQNEYSYFKQHSLPMWAGPDQWKNRAQFNALKGVSKSATQKQNSTRKKVFRIDFDETPDFERIFSKGKAATVLSNTTMNKHASADKTLPDDLHYEFNDLMKVFLKSKLLIRRQYGVQPAITDDGSGKNWYDYDNENDRANYCPDTQGDDGEDDDVSGAGEIGVFNEGDSTQEMSQALSSFNSNETVFHGDNLVTQPNKVQKIDILYSKTAKKIDVKKVKNVMWDFLTSSSRDVDKENIPENAENETTEDEDVKESVSKPCTFTELYNTIPNKLPKQMAKNLSVPIAFVCILHLTNEKKLKLNGCTSMDDFTITQEIGQ